jgi:quercetin dioxygenase-like cupin family protein
MLVEKNEEDGEMIWPIDVQYPNLNIPETWDTLEDFVKWYMEAGKPILVPWNARVIRTDDATAICVFKHDRYLVEMYMIHPGRTIPKHCHPGVEIITVLAGGGIVSGKESLYGTSKWCGKTLGLSPGEYHGGTNPPLGTGFVLYSFEKWLGDTNMTSAAVQWKGPTAGSIHDSLINKYYPEALVEPGQADITKIFNK